MNTNQLSVIIPVYNEEKTIKKVIEEVLMQPLVGQIVLVDDASTDTSLSIIKTTQQKENKIKFIQLQKNHGKGFAIREGIRHATCPLLIIQDADLEYDPKEYNTLLDPIINDKADIVFGSRFKGGNSHRVLYFWHCIGNKFLTLLSNMFTNLNLSDMETCYKAMRTEIAKSLDLHENRFGIEPELTAKLAKTNKRIFEVGISYYGRTYAEGKKITWKDGFRAIYCILKYR
jgi:glycosyltransferase involved in cell wall biosynthesis